MDHARSDTVVTLGDFSLLLLDDPAANERRRELSAFPDLADWVERSLETRVAPAAQAAAASEAQAFSVAGRLVRSHYEDQMKAEALLSAIRKIRGRTEGKAPYKNSARVIKAD